MANFKVGNVVRLKTGGQKMTVASVDKKDVECLWFVNTTLKRKKFNKNTLILVEE